jgi:hypothetical protein
MQNTRLLDRQVELLRHLTDVELIFAGGKFAEEDWQLSLCKLSVPHLRLEAEMSFAKRMSKVGKVFRRTLLCAGGQRATIVRDFAAACSPISGRRTEEALRFYEFLLRRWTLVPPQPPFITDVAELEIAIARVAAFRKAGDGVPPVVAPEKIQGRAFVRLSEGIEIVHLRYDLRALFQGENGTTPGARENYLLIGQIAGARSPKIAEISRAENAVLGQLRDWVPLESLLGDGAGARPSLDECLRKFRAASILEATQ